MESAGNGRSQLGVLVSRSPYRPDCMDNKAAGQATGAGDRRLTVGNESMIADPYIALVLDFTSAGAHDRGRQTAAMGKMLIGGIDDGVDMFLSQIPVNQAQYAAARHRLFSNYLRHKIVPYRVY